MDWEENIVINQWNCNFTADPMIYLEVSLPMDVIFRHADKPLFEETLKTKRFKRARAVHEKSFFMPRK